MQPFLQRLLLTLVCFILTFSVYSQKPLIDLYQLKVKYQRFSTSSLAPDKRKEYVCIPQQGGLLGNYNLIDDSSQFVGILYVYNPTTPPKWRLDNKVDELVELELTAGDFKVLGNRIGQSYDELVKSLKAQGHFHYKKGSAVYYKIDDYWYIFNIKDDKIASIKVQRDCKK